MQLRPYQQAAIDAVWTYLHENAGNPCVVLPTGSGKTPVLAHIAKQVVGEWGGRVLILAHVRELLQQACEKLSVVWPGAPVGLYSAGLKSRQSDTAIVVAGIQSVWNKADLLGSFDLVIIDEVHLIPPDGDGMYRSLLSDLRVINPRLRLVGLTATDYRLGTGRICGPDNLLTDVCYEAKVRDLIDAGFLCSLRGKSGAETDLSGVHVRGGDYIPSELQDAMADEETVALAADEMLLRLADRTSWIVFCSGVTHAGMVLAALTARGVEAALVTGETPSDERAETIALFKAGTVRAMVNVTVLTIGFDAPNIDAVVLLRPTLSAGLYYQMVGRGLRMSPGKRDCLVLDFAGCIALHGPIDRIDVRAPAERDGDGVAPSKTCPRCAEILPMAMRMCPACDFEFPPLPVAKHATQAAPVAPISAPAVEHIWDVTDMSYQVWTKKGAEPGAPKTVCITYFSGQMRSVREWICCEHSGYAAGKARSWWSLRCSEPMPTSAADAVAMAHAGKLLEPSRVVVKVGGQYPEIVRQLFDSPCTTCRHFDGGHCHQWGNDVPEANRSQGCSSHARVPEGAALTDDDFKDCPF